eukprot:gnl/TRDRNA2_/TRDRNA2_152273_c1_seq1.p1 gnl/TRDRNA2_/TRDRNA2_152273_c1~~gnl/TRDRNA2_/TRDRNA2_152273_c1_seq1.p1  ORF type:complete len:185 (-),score=52.82 gnl/TRDRNA2_/TRDRNA2_152273_c1_seq1:44-568(-)
MGAGATAPVAAAVLASPRGELDKCVGALDEDVRMKILTAMNEGAPNVAAEPEKPSDAQPAAKDVDGVDRSSITRNANGSEEPSSADPELWNIDDCEVDILVKYKMGGQMWYVQSRMRENNAKNKPIAGFPMNKKAEDAKRYYTKDDEEFNVGSTNFGNAKEWKEIEAANPPKKA